MAVKIMEDFAESLKKHEEISIYIGERSADSQPYVISKTLLCSSSRYFIAALRPGFKEGERGELHFPEDDKDGWLVLLYWMYHHTVPRLVLAQDIHRSDSYWTTLAEAWMLGDQYDMPVLQNEITRAFVAALQVTKQPLQQVQEVLDIVSDDCPITELMAEELVVERVNGTYTWRDFKHLVKYEGVFVVFMDGWETYILKQYTPAEYNSIYPLHQYGANEREMNRYLVSEEFDEELEESGAGIIGQ